MTLARAPLGATIAASIVVGTSISIGPIWQIHDDAYYAMLADGYGILTAPVGSLPYMHPFVTWAISQIRSVGIEHSYSSYLFICIFLGSIAIFYRIVAEKRDYRYWLMAVPGIFSIALLPQYTAVAGFLVASAVILWSKSKSHRITRVEWLLGGSLILLATFFRAQMAILAVICLLPVIASQHISSLKVDLKWLFSFGATICGVTAIFAAASVAMSDNRLNEFYRLNDPMADVMNYGYLEAIRLFKLPLPAEYTATDIDALSHWFFGELSLLESKRMGQLVESVPLSHLLRIRYWETIAYSNGLAGGLSLWFLLAAAAISGASRLRFGLWASIAIFLAASTVSALLLKPFPERVSIGIAVGLFLLAMVTRRERVEGHSLWVARVTTFFGCALLIPVAINIIDDRQEVLGQVADWENDSKALPTDSTIYAFVGSLPLRAAFRPFDVSAQKLNILFLGSMYLIPEVLDKERSLDCDGFIKCLGAGRMVNVTANEDSISMLIGLVKERYQQHVTIDAVINTPSFSMFQLNVK